MHQTQSQPTFLLDGRSATDHFPGIGRYVSNLAQALVPILAEDEHLLILRDATQKSQWQLPESSEKVTVIDTAVSPFSFKQQWQIPSLVKEYKISCYHSPYYLMPYRMKVPTILTLYDLIPQKYPEYVAPRARLMVNTLTRVAMRYSDRYIAISEATKQDFLSSFKLERNTVTAVPLAADPKFKPSTQTVPNKYKLPANYILYLGINKPHKNLVQLIRAWHQVQKQIAPSQTLIIAGAWDARYPEAKRLATELNVANVQFLGPIEDQDLPALYSHADLFVFPSIYEGFGLPILEAMACGTAVTCSNTSSLPEVGGEAVLYFNPKNVEEISRQISKLLQDANLRETYSKKGLEQANKFSWHNTAVATLNIYRELSG